MKEYGASEQARERKRKSKSFRILLINLFISVNFAYIFMIWIINYLLRTDDYSNDDDDDDDDDYYDHDDYVERFCV